MLSRDGLPAARL